MNRLTVDEGEYLKGKKSASKLDDNNHFQKQILWSMMLYVWRLLYSSLMGS